MIALIHAISLGESARPRHKLTHDERERRFLMQRRNQESRAIQPGVAPTASLVACAIAFSGCWPI